MTRRGCGYGYAYGGSYACSYCNHTLYPQAAGEFYRYFNEVDFRFSQIPAATNTRWVVLFFYSSLSSVRWPLRAACTFLTLVGASGLPP